MVFVHWRTHSYSLCLVRSCSSRSVLFPLRPATLTPLSFLHMYVVPMSKLMWPMTSDCHRFLHDPSHLLLLLPWGECWPALDSGMRQRYCCTFPKSLYKGGSGMKTAQ